MSKDNEIVETLEKRETELWHILVEDESVHHPEVIYRVVIELRSVHNLIKLFKNHTS